MSLVEDFSTITELFIRIVERYSNESKPAVMYKVGGKYKKISYLELRENVERFANGLASLGVQRGMNIGLIMENRPEWIYSDMAIQLLGAVSVPLYTTQTPQQIEYIFNDAGVTIVIVSNQFQLNKIMKIFDSVKSLEKVIVIGNGVKNTDERIFTMREVMIDGDNFKSKNPDYLKNELEKIRPDDLLTIIYTSGTTGNPKGVMLTHKNLVSNIKSSAKCIPVGREDILLSYLPLCHSFERMAGYYTAFACGATIAYAESIESLPVNMMEVKPTIMTSVPRLFERMFNRMMKRVNDFSLFRRKIFFWSLKIGKEMVKAKHKKQIPLLLSLRYRLADLLVFKKIRARTGGRIRFFVSGGAPLSRELGEFFEALGIRILEGYGLSETSPVISVNTLEEYKYGTVGKPIPGVEVKIAEDGEILARGPNIMKGYWNNDEATKEIIDTDGWLHTGDIGMFDEDGFLIITDRKKHIFVSSGGKNIAPQHIENLFQQSALIDQFVLIGDKRMFCSALIYPDMETLKSLAKQRNISYKSNKDLLENAEIYNLFEQEINGLQKDLAQYERVRRFTFLPEPLSIENGELTPTMKIRRKVVEEKYKSLIDSMYESIY